MARSKRMDDGSDKVKIGVPVDKKLWLRLRALAIREGKLTGELLNASIQGYLDSHER